MSSSYAMLLLLLPVALAALCPCPPSSKDSPVCGTDGRTYASECELRCAGLPGLAADHPGPCAPQEAAAGRHRRYAVEFSEWNPCHEERKCAPPYWGNCSECGEGSSWSKCRQMCSWNCACGCARLPTGGLDKDSRDLFDTCIHERECTDRKRDTCSTQCSDQFCVELCHMDHVKCSCSCIQHAAASWTNTTTAPTSRITPPATSSSTVPTTGSTSTSSTKAPPPGPAPGVTTAKQDQRADQPAAAAAPAVYVLWDSGVVLLLAWVCVCVSVCVLVRWRASVVCCPLGSDRGLTALCRVGPPPAAESRLPTKKETDRDDVELNAYAQHGD
ncbi:uncharacterized protein LOC113213178 [Frankliniella occidentalis]|uniref:Uncharacterized protein LOC113213178 n=1 Tax=Frankliniella occidentalis TaxID=133901 RepID=A0A6J1T4S7_FRAOC|nr:uncharacterized protein LOC113213178 [Frankliniella occidentalis]